MNLRYVRVHRSISVECARYNHHNTFDVTVTVVACPDRPGVGQFLLPCCRNRYICSTLRKFPPPKCFRNNSRSYWRLFDSVRDFCIIPERIDENFFFFGFFFFLSAVVFLTAVIVFFGATAVSFILIVVDWEGGTEEEVDDDAEVPTGTILVVEGSRCSASSIDGCCIIGMPFTSLPQDEPAVFADTGVMFVSVVDDGEAAAAAVAGLAEAEAEAAPIATACGTAVMAM